MRILHIVDSLDRGGLEHVVCDLSAEQLRRGYQVGVYCLHAPGSLAAGLEATGVQVTCGHKRAGADFRVVRELRRLATESHVALLHSHSMMPNYYACAARLLAPRAITVVNTRHDMGSTRPNDPREKLYRLSVPLTRFAVMVSERVKERFVAAGIVPARKARVVLNGIRTDCPRRDEPGQRAEARRRLGAADGQFAIGCIGRLVELKDHATAIRCLAKLPPGRQQPRLFLIGAGPLQGQLEALTMELGLGSRVQFLGERSDARELLPGLDVFLLPSLTEGHSIAMLEAAAAALPIVGTRVGGNPEIVEHERTGLLVPAGDEASMVAALQRLFGDTVLAARMGAAARAWALKHISVPAMADGYESVYAEAINLH
ncbi:MAG: glycosyl transferase [Gammaproteobacteria bacterium]|nr:glycosyl transferase [Gammaproteobacteria bacterium]